MEQVLNSLETEQGYHPATRWLHAGLVLGVIFQLSVASLMTHPKHQHRGDKQMQTSTQVLNNSKEVQHHNTPHSYADTQGMTVENMHEKPENGSFGTMLMQAHRFGGLWVVVIVFLNLAWAIFRRGKPKKRQIAVLLSKQHWCEALVIIKNLPLMLTGKSPMADSGNALALIIEMLGLLTMTAMATTGLIIWNLWAGLGSDVSPSAQLLMQVHGAIAIVLFVYLAGHISMALLHLRAGEKVFTRISPFGVKREQND